MMSVLLVVTRIVDLAFQALMLAILINALLSWIHPRPYNAFVNFIEAVANTVCNPIRRVIPTVVAGMDISPIIAMVLLSLLQGIVHRVLLG